MTTSDNDLCYASAALAEATTTTTNAASNASPTAGFNEMARAESARERLQTAIHVLRQKSLPSNDLELVQLWKKSFASLFIDARGVEAFATLLKKSMALENLDFFIKCEHYRSLNKKSLRRAKAREIFNEFLAEDSLTTININQKQCESIESRLEYAERDLFMVALQEVLNMLEGHCYTSFKSSECYKKCEKAAENKEPLPYTGKGYQDVVKAVLKPLPQPKLEKSPSVNEDGRRKSSILPWLKKARSRSHDRPDDNPPPSHVNGCDNNKSKTLMPAPAGRATVAAAGMRQRSFTDIHSSRSSLHQSMELRGNVCRLILADGAMSTVEPNADETVEQCLERCLKRRGLKYKSYYVTIRETRESIDIRQPAKCLIGLEVHVEERIPLRPDSLREQEPPSTLEQDFRLSGGNSKTIPPTSCTTSTTTAAVNELSECATLNDSNSKSVLRRNSTTAKNKLANCRTKHDSTSSQHSEDSSSKPSTGASSSTNSSCTPNAAAAATAAADPKKPIIAKLKAGVKLQGITRVAENQELEPRRERRSWSCFFKRTPN